MLTEGGIYKNFEKYPKNIHKTVLEDLFTKWSLTSIQFLTICKFIISPSLAVIWISFPEPWWWVWKIFHFTFRLLIIQISINLLKYWDNITKLESILSNWAQICKLQLSFNNYMSSGPYEHRKTGTFLGLENQSDRSLKITKLISLERISFKLLKSWVKSLGNPTFWFFRKQN